MPPREEKPPAQPEETHNSDGRKDNPQDCNKTANITIII